MDFSYVLTYMQSARKLYELKCTALTARFHLNQTEIDVLGFLSNNPNMNTASHIVEYRLIPKANVSKAVDTLTNRGLLSAVRDQKDRRRVTLLLTDSSAPVVKEIQDLQREFISELTRNFTSEELSACVHYLKRMNKNAQAAIKEEMK